MPLFTGHFYLQFTLTICCGVKKQMLRFKGDNYFFWHNYRKE